MWNSVTESKWLVVTRNHGSSVQYLATENAKAPFYLVPVLMVKAALSKSSGFLLLQCTMSNVVRRLSVWLQQSQRCFWIVLCLLTQKSSHWQWKLVVTWYSDSGMREIFNNMVRSASRRAWWAVLNQTNRALLTSIINYRSSFRSTPCLTHMKKRLLVIAHLGLWSRFLFMNWVRAR